MTNLKKIIAVVGPTASGKTSLAIELAKEFNGEIISVDSRQVYREMDIGTAKEGRDIYKDKETGLDREVDDAVFPLSSQERGVGGEFLSDADRYFKFQIPEDSPVSLQGVLKRAYPINGVFHYMIDIVNPDQVLTLAHFQALAFGVVEDIISRGKVPILAGGTGLYTSAILENWNLPDIEPDQNLRKKLDKLSDEELANRLKEIDPQIAKAIDLDNRRRVVRAIEVVTSPPNPLFLKGRGESRYNALIIGPEFEREELYSRINQRVDQMIDQGLVEEVKSVREKYGDDTVAMTGIGYRQIVEYLNKEKSLEESVEEIKKATRNYAKRQMTWWRKHGPITLVKDVNEAIIFVKKFLVK